MIEKNLITTSKNLLAFSGGVDSTALFFLLLEDNIPFDICIVDYHQRDQSKEEIAYAKTLALKYNKQCFTIDYPYSKFNEKDARDFRYEVFLQIINEYNYESLITAHQLNDKLEWFLMQLSKGAGLNELVGLISAEDRGNYTLYRPLLNISKKELIEYLKIHHYKYFIDNTNNDTKYKRNFFRHEFSDKFIDLYKDGVTKSFSYLQRDIDSLVNLYTKSNFDELVIFSFTSYDENSAIRMIDKELKKRGILLSSKTRKEILEIKSLVVSHKISIEIDNNSIWIAPHIQNNMDKKFKERCRIAKIPKNIRPYLYRYSNDENLWTFLKELK